MINSDIKKQFVVPRVSPEQKQEILYQHVLGYFLTGIGYAKLKGSLPKEFGEYIGRQFTPFWNPDDGFATFVNGLLFILNGLHPDNEMQILEQSGDMIRFRLKNVDLMFTEGPAFGISYEEMLECSEAVINTLAEHMGSTFSQKIDDGWYEVLLTSK